jgi:uncharacterized membrane protein
MAKFLIVCFLIDTLKSILRCLAKQLELEKQERERKAEIEK